jgi:hypothetical protein
MTVRPGRATARFQNSGPRAKNGELLTYVSADKLMVFARLFDLLLESPWWDLLRTPLVRLQSENISPRPDSNSRSLGSWTDKPIAATFPRGFLTWTHLSEADRGTFNDWDLLEQEYYMRFEELKRQDILRDARLTKNGETIHSWDCGGNL